MRLLSLPVALVVVLLLPAAAAQGASRPSGDEWVEGDHTFVFASLSELETSGDLDLRRITVDGERYEADELRAAYRAIVAASGPAAGRAFVSAVEALLAESYLENLENAFPGADIAPPTAEVDEASLAHERGGDPNDPPVRVALESTLGLGPGSFGFEGVTADDIDAILGVGAEIDVPITFFADPGHQSAFEVEFPDDLVTKDAKGTAFEGPVVETVDNRLGSDVRRSTETVRLASRDVAPPSEARGAIDVVVDITDLDVSIADAAGGDFGNMVIEILGTAELDTIVFDDATSTGLPRGVHLDAIEADGLRTLVARGLLKQADLDRASNALVARLGERLSQGLGSSPEGLDGGFSTSTFEDGPVVFEVRAKVTRPLTGGAQRSAALALYTVTQSLPFERIEGLDTVYHVVFPRGLAATSATSDGGDVSTIHREDGRDEVVLALTGDDAPDSATMEVQVAVTPTFVLAKFWPVVLLAVLVVVAVLGAITFGVVRAFRK